MSTSSRPLPPHLSGGSAPVPATTGPVGGPPPRGSRTRARDDRAYTFRERVRIAIRGVGEILITLGLVLLLFCAYQLWWTDVTSNRASTAELHQLDTTFAQTPKLVGNVIPPPTKPPAGQPFARMYVPRFGDSWVRPVIQGVELVDLHKGVGHYPKSALPGQVGNFAVAGHRTTNGHPFRNIDKLQVGDKVFVETQYAWYVYTVSQVRLVVSPGDTYVVAPVPTKGATAAPTQRLMTMTSCHPPYSASQRMVAHASLTETRARGLGPPAGAPPGVT